MGAHAVAVQKPVQAAARPQQVVLCPGGNVGDRHMLVVDDRGLVIFQPAVPAYPGIAHLFHMQQARGDCLPQIPGHILAIDNEA